LEATPDLADRLKQPLRQTKICANLNVSPRPGNELAENPH